MYKESSNRLGSQKLFESLKARMINKKCDTILYVHGYNVSFKESLEVAARLRTIYRIQGRPPFNVLVFSWPSDASAAFYRSDRHDAETSGLAIARGLLKTVEFLRTLSRREQCRQKIHLVAHSMGIYAFRHALQELIGMSSQHLPRLLDELVLAAADEDDDAFELSHKLARLPELGKRVTVYFNRSDRALTASDVFKGNPDRLGSDGPRSPRALHAKLNPVDCSDIDHKFPGHSYFRQTNRVVRDVIDVLAGTPSDQIQGPVYVPMSNRSRLF